MSTTAAARSQSPGSGDWKETIGRVGLVGKGALYTVVGVLAVQLAAGDASRDTTKNGAIEWIAAQPFGKFLLVGLTVCLFALAAWRLLDAAVGDPVEGREASDRAKFAVKGLLYLSLAVGALTTTIANWSGGGSSSAGSTSGGRQQTTATVLGWPAGRWIVAAAGLAVIAYALYVFKLHAVDERFLQRVSVSADSVVAKLGRLGYAARSVVFLVVGYFLFQAGLTYQAGTTKGLSGALQEISGKGWGQWLLWAVALGLFSYGLFTLAEARYRRAA